ncbi:hypothetical protein AB0C50_22075 [Micromonospora taraxaci]|uniref:hypothetical protein n=1 Tax=Micromonospora taraxaci TaxID=1316803 RepID=UPI0033C41D18
MDTVDFRTWCTVRVPVPTAGHHAGLIESYDDATGVATLAAAYAESAALARLAQRMGKTAVAKFLSNLLPITAAARSGDMGEILATAYLHEEGQWVVGPSRLIHRDHQEWAMRGDDVLGAKIDADCKALIIKAEAKSRIKLDKRTVTDARDGLTRNEEMPSPHSLAQFAKRLESTPDEAVGDAIVDLQLLEGPR